jgi:hypothetical protein
MSHSYTVFRLRVFTSPSSMAKADSLETCASGACEGIVVVKKCFVSCMHVLLETGVHMSCHCDIACKPI